MPYRFSRSGPKSDDDGRPFRGNEREWLKTKKSYDYKVHSSKYSKRRR